MNKQLTPKQRKAVEELLKRNISQADLYQAEQTPPRLGILNQLFPLQREIIEDPAKRKCLLFGRRGSKTHILVTTLVVTAEKHPGSTCVFIGLTRKSAKRLIWSDLEKFNRNYSLGLQMNGTDLTAKLPNGSVIWVTGCEKKGEEEKIRGGAYKLVCIDESGSFDDKLEYLVEDVIEPALADYEGTLYLSGTPNATCTGYYYKATTENIGFKTWRSTVLQNEKFPLWSGKSDWQTRAKNWLEGERKRKQWSESTPKYRREWLAQWVRETSDAVLDFEESRNTYEDLPNVPLSYVLGIDTGVKDATALVVTAYSRYDSNLYIIDTDTGSGWSFDETVAKIKALDEEYEFDVMVCDPAAAGALFVQDLSNQYDLPIEAAQKREKAAFLQQLSSEFRSGRVKIHNALYKTIDDFKKLQWKDSHRREIVGAERHELDALRYAFVEVLGCRGREDFKPPQRFNDPEEQKLAEEYENEMMDDLGLEDLCEDLF